MLRPEVDSICLALQVQQAQTLQLRNELQLRGAGGRGQAGVEAEAAQAAPVLVSSLFDVVLQPGTNLQGCRAWAGYSRCTIWGSVSPVAAPCSSSMRHRCSHS